MRDRLRPFQLQALWLLAVSGGKLLLADEMGLGKTAEALAAAALFRPDWPALLVVPSCLRWQWAEEVERWLPSLGPRDVHVVESVRGLTAELAGTAGAILGLEPAQAAAVMEATGQQSHRRRHAGGTRPPPAAAAGGGAGTADEAPGAGDAAAPHPSSPAASASGSSSSAAAAESSGELPSAAPRHEPRLVIVSYTMLTLWAERAVSALGARGLSGGRTRRGAAAGGGSRHIGDDASRPFHVIGSALAARFGLLIADEAHYLREASSTRSRTVAAAAQACRRAVLLTGTPCLTKPLELFPVLQALRPDVDVLRAGWRRFARRYAGPEARPVFRRGARPGLQETFDGASCTAELYQVLCRLAMVRRRKVDVLGQLPAKSRQAVSLPLPEGGVPAMRGRMQAERQQMRAGRAGSTSLTPAERLTLVGGRAGEEDAAARARPGRTAAAEDDGEDGVVVIDEDEDEGDGADGGGAMAELLELADADDDASEAVAGVGGMAAVRATRVDLWHATARAKAPLVAAFLLETLRGRDSAAEGKVLVFGHHRAMLDHIEGALAAEPGAAGGGGLGWNPGVQQVRIDGATPSEERARLVTVFHESPRCQLALVSTRAGGVGLDLTPAHLVVFAELDWIPGQVLQAEDRAYRMSGKGRTGAPAGPHAVSVRYLLAHGTADDVMWPRFLQRAGDIAAAIDDDRTGLAVKMEPRRKTAHGAAAARGAAPAAAAEGAPAARPDDATAEGAPSVPRNESEGTAGSGASGGSGDAGFPVVKAEPGRGKPGAAGQRRASAGSGGRGLRDDDDDDDGASSDDGAGAAASVPLFGGAVRFAVSRFTGSVHLYDATGRHLPVRFRPRDFAAVAEADTPWAEQQAQGAGPQLQAQGPGRMPANMAGRDLAAAASAGGSRSRAVRSERLAARLHEHERKKRGDAAELHSRCGGGADCAVVALSRGLATLRGADDSGGEEDEDDAGGKADGAPDPTVSERCRCWEPAAAAFSRAWADLRATFRDRLCELPPLPLPLDGAVTAMATAGGTDAAARAIHVQIRWLATAGDVRNVVGARFAATQAQAAAVGAAMGEGHVFERHEAGDRGVVGAAALRSRFVPCAQCGCAIAPSDLVHVNVMSRERLQRIRAARAEDTERRERAEERGRATVAAASGRGRAGAVPAPVRPGAEPIGRGGGLDAASEVSFVVPYCSAQCRRDYAAARASGVVRRLLGRVEHGVCQCCGIDARSLWRALVTAGRTDLQAAAERCRLAEARAEEASAVRAAAVAASRGGGRRAPRRSRSPGEGRGQDDGGDERAKRGAAVPAAGRVTAFFRPVERCGRASASSHDVIVLDDTVDDEALEAGAGSPTPTDSRTRGGTGRGDSAARSPPLGTPADVDPAAADTVDAAAGEQSSSSSSSSAALLPPSPAAAGSDPSPPSPPPGTGQDAGSAEALLLRLAGEAAAAREALEEAEQRVVALRSELLDRARWQPRKTAAASKRFVASMRLTEGMFWEADHITPVAEGGGRTGALNYRTLCVACHRQATAALAKRLAKRRTLRPADAKGTGRIQPAHGGPGAAATPAPRAQFPMSLALTGRDGEMPTLGSSIATDFSAPRLSSSIASANGGATAARPAFAGLSADSPQPPPGSQEGGAPMVLPPSVLSP